MYLAAPGLVAAFGIQLPDQGSNPGPLHWERRVLATGPPRKFSSHYSDKLSFHDDCVSVCLKAVSKIFLVT